MVINEERLEAAARNLVMEQKDLRACVLAELGKVTSGSAIHCLWLGDGKVRSQVVGEEQC